MPEARRWGTPAPCMRAQLARPRPQKEYQRVPPSAYRTHGGGGVGGLPVGQAHGEAATSVRAGRAWPATRQSNSAVVLLSLFIRARVRPHRGTRAELEGVAMLTDGLAMEPLDRQEAIAQEHCVRLVSGAPTNLAVLAVVDHPREAGTRPALDLILPHLVGSDVVEDAQHRRHRPHGRKRVHHLFERVSKWVECMAIGTRCKLRGWHGQTTANGGQG